MKKLQNETNNTETELSQYVDCPSWLQQTSGESQPWGQVVEQHCKTKSMYQASTRAGLKSPQRQAVQHWLRAMDINMRLLVLPDEYTGGVVNCGC